ncbi:hypothetical protein F5Y19DRAFT_481161 [Xylariaceae sp. FL1651]|nr:hypothetical protein F5Y19DRAFT_481161 [Xylariaceae sp. FL1651]
MRFPTIQLVGLMGIQAVFGHPALEHNSNNAVVERDIDSELYLDEIKIGDQIGSGVDAKVYKVKVPNTPGFGSSTTYALKQDYSSASSLQTEFDTYKATDGQGIAPAFQAIVQDMDSLDNVGILVEYIDGRTADENSKDDAMDGTVLLVDFTRSQKTNDAKKKEDDVNILKMAFSGVEFDGDNVAN